MNLVKKLGIYLILFIPAAIVAAVYGAVHDQISYTFSPEYFTHFEFIQFAIPWIHEAPRIGAGFVGVLATWWIGVLVFIVLGLFGFIFPNTQVMAKELLCSSLIVILVALVIGVIGLVYGYIQVSPSSIQQYIHRVRPGVTDDVQFIRVGFMHNASYLGGLTGLLAGITYLFAAKNVITRAVSRTPQAVPLLKTLASQTTTFR